ncbi:MAG TPA: divalent-cation tolerance protein CutA [Candidatus Acidoferrum sp.]|nr:divalent-cation tolerance protein CutA [Candidatus Acidoferrum sp.]
MKKADQFAIVLVTAPDRKTARGLARAALEERAAACANLAAGLESHYWWQGKMERSAEVLIIFKTTRRRLGALEELILRKHPYDTPEILALRVEAGTERYLHWISASLEGGKKHA